VRLCAACHVELALAPDVSHCPRCGGLALAMRPAVDPNLGRVLDERYEIRSLLGVGGMGTVYRAWQRSVGRDVAIKLVHRRYRSDVKWIRRFLREARLSSQVHHPHTVGIVDFGQTAEGDLFLAMELLAGRTLSEVVRQEGAFSPRRTLGVGVQICDALAALHERRIVHRDLTPQNIMVLDQPAGRDHVKLLDFGLAKSLADGDPSMTQDSQLIGTPGYMAPEVPREAASPASDL
jgi:eukaryotic-like serine/threonine-protein kinase